MEIKQFDKVELISDYVVDRITNEGQKKDIYKKGSIGYAVDILNDKDAFVEFSYKEYSNPVAAVPLSLLKKI